MVYACRWECCSPRPEKSVTVERLCVPFTHSQRARHWNLRRLGRIRQRLPGAAERLDIDAVVDGGGFGLSHLWVLSVSGRRRAVAASSTHP